jgi:hypothetical protein
MHVEKGVFESIIDLLLDIPSKTKDGLSVCKDLQTFRIREELHPQVRPNGKVYLPLASYTLTTEEKMAICKCLLGITVPTGFLSNIKNLVSMSHIKHPQGVEVDDYGFTIIDLRNVGHKDESWLLAATVTQVFYILDSKDEKKHIVVPGKQRVPGVNNMDDKEEYNQCDDVPFFVDTKRINIIEMKLSYSNVIPYTCTDGEGKLVHV